MPTSEEIEIEASKFRDLIDNCDKQKTKLIVECFPEMSCKVASMLLSYHFFTVWPKLVIKGVGGATGSEREITHYWLEVEGVVIDITGDQYNTINFKELNKAIIGKRPFEPVHVANVNSSYLHELFDVIYEDSFTSGFPDLGVDFIEDMKLGYSQLLNQSIVI